MAGPMELFSVAAKLFLDRSEYDSDVKEADRSGKTLAENLSSYMEKAKKVISALGVGLMIKKAAGSIWDLAKETSAAGDRIDKQSQALGMSRKAYQEWDYILAQSGASIDSMGMSMKTMSEAIHENSAETAAGLSKLGLSAAHLQSLSPEDQFETLVRAFQKMPAGAEKSRLAMQLFGRNAQSLMPLLNSSSDSIDELRKNAHDLGLIMSDEDVDASVAFGDALDDLGRTWNSFKYKIGAQLLPGFTGVIKNLTTTLGNISTALVGAIKTGDWGAFFQTITTEIENLIPGMVDTVVKFVTGLFENADKLIGLAVSIITGIVNGIIDSLPILIEKLPAIINTIWEGEDGKGGLKSLIINLGNWVIDKLNETFGLNIPHIDDIKFPSIAELGTIISDWWDGGNGAKKAIESACTWVLKLFGVPDETVEEISKNISDWWGGVVSFVVDACSWVLGLFGLPTNVDTEKLKKDVELWFSGLSGIIIDACNWVLNLFGLPTVDTEALKKDVGNWFNGFVNVITDACSWVLGLFGLPTNVDLEKLQKDVELWFNGLIGTILQACNWVLNLFGLPEVDKEQLQKDMTTWFSGLVGIIEDACSWVLGLFGLPTVDLDKLHKDIESWFSGLSGTIIEACNWVLAMFGLPTVDKEKLRKDVTDWFAGCYNTLVDACSWVIGLFGLPTNVDLEQLKKDVSKWFSGFVGTLVDACNWVLRIFGLPEINLAALSKTVSTWWSGVVGTVEEACNWTLKMFGLPTISEISSAIKTWWGGDGTDENRGMKALIADLLDWTLGTLGLPNFSTIVSQITTWWNEQVLPNLKLGFNVAFNGVFGTGLFGGGPAKKIVESTLSVPEGSPAGTPFIVDMSGQSGGGGRGGFAKGLNYVPFDGYALLHRGEAILNQNQGREWRQNGNASGVNSQQLYGVVASAVADAVRDIQINLDGRAVGDAVAGQVGRNLYQSQRGRRFA